MRISLGTVNINAKAKKMMRKALDEGLIGQSHYIQEFEERFADFIGSRYAIAVSSGTMADTIALAVLKHFYPNRKKVLVPALTFIAQVNSIYYNHLEPVFVDYGKIGVWEEDTLCSFPVHLLGRPETVNFGPLMIEDACEALGSSLNGKYCGTLGTMGTFSFFPSHSITTGEGGMIVTNDKEFTSLARQLRTQGRRGEDVLNKFHFDVIGFNGRMTTMQAVIGLSIMDDLPEILAGRHENYLYLGGEEFAHEYIVPHGFPSFYDSKEKRDEKLLELTLKGIECRKLFSCIPTDEKAYAFLGHKRGEFPVSEDMADKGLYVPCHQNLTKKELNEIRANL